MVDIDLQKLFENRQSPYLLQVGLLGASIALFGGEDRIVCLDKRGGEGRIVCFNKE